MPGFYQNRCSKEANSPHRGQIGRGPVRPRAVRVCALNEQRRGGGTKGRIIGLLVLWVVLAVVGFVVKSLFWLAIVAIVLFIATGIFGAMRRRAPR